MSVACKISPESDVKRVLQSLSLFSGLGSYSYMTWPLLDFARLAETCPCQHFPGPLLVSHSVALVSSIRGNWSLS